MLSPEENQVDAIPVCEASPSPRPSGRPAPERKLGNPGEDTGTVDPATRGSTWSSILRGS